MEFPPAIVPFVPECYRARFEQILSHLWHWSLVRSIWHGSTNGWHHPVFRGNVRSLGAHRASFKVSNSTATQDDGVDEVDFCALRHQTLW